MTTLQGILINLGSKIEEFNAKECDRIESTPSSLTIIQRLTTAETRALKRQRIIDEFTALCSEFGIR